MKLYVLDILIAKKALDENKSKKQIVDEISELLGLGYARVNTLRNMKVGQPGMKTSFIIKLAEYFNVNADDLINPSAKDSILQDDQIKSL